MSVDRNPYQTSPPLFDAPQRVPRKSTLTFGGFCKALYLWGFVFVLSATVPLLVQAWPKLPNQQPLIFYLLLFGFAVCGSALNWIWFFLADVSSKKSRILMIALYTIAFAIATLPGFNSLYHYSNGSRRIPGTVGMLWYTFRGTIFLLLPTLVYAFGRTKRWTESPVEGS
jgi:hypothetical protein